MEKQTDTNLVQDPDQNDTTIGCFGNLDKKIHLKEVA